jgi:hypothetical protein
MRGCGKQGREVGRRELADLDGSFGCGRQAVVPARCVVDRGLVLSAAQVLLLLALQELMK